MQVGKLFIFIILTLGAISTAWAAPKISSSCRFLLMDDEAIFLEVKSIETDVEKATSTEEIQAAIANLREASQVLFRRGHEHGASEIYTKIDALVERIDVMESIFPVQIDSEPVAVYALKDTKKASHVLRKIEARVFEVHRLDQKNTLVAYVTELTVHAKAPHDIYFSENFHRRMYSPIAKAFDNETKKLAFDKIIESVPVDLERIHSQASQGVFRALFFNQPLASGLLEKTNYLERMNNMAQMDFIEALDIDFDPNYSNDFGGYIVEQVLEIVNMNPQDVINSQPKR